VEHGSLLEMVENCVVDVHRVDRLDRLQARESAPNGRAAGRRTRVVIANTRSTDFDLANAHGAA
jgi:hypothetical protein